MAAPKMQRAARPRDAVDDPLENIARMVIHRAAMNTEGAAWPFRFALLEAVVDYEEQSREKLEKAGNDPALVSQCVAKIDKAVWPAIATLLDGQFDITAPEALQLIHGVGGVRMTGAKIKPRAGGAGLSNTACLAACTSEDNSPSPDLQVIDEQRVLLRDAALETLSRGAREMQRAMLCFENEGDAGAVRHFSRLITTMKSAAGTLNELRALQEGGPAQ